MLRLAERVKAQLSAGAPGGGPGGGDGVEDGTPLAAQLLQAANAEAPSGCAWVWGRAGWEVRVDSSTDDHGWRYGSDWPRLPLPREGGRAAQRTTDLVRRRKLTRGRLQPRAAEPFRRRPLHHVRRLADEIRLKVYYTWRLNDRTARRIARRLLVELGPGPTPAGVAVRLGGEADPRAALLGLEAGTAAKRAAADRARAGMLAAVRVLFKAHVLSRRLADQPLDPTAWCRMTPHRV